MTYGKDKLRQVLLWQLGRFVPHTAIEDVLWGDREDGGPIDAKHIIRHYVYLLRKEGELIESRRWFGLKMQSGAA